MPICGLSGRGSWPPVRKKPNSNMNNVIEPAVIGLAGAARTGKDTVGEHLEGRGYVRFAFADKVREKLLELDPLVWIGAPGCPTLIENFSRTSGLRYVHVTTLVSLFGWEVAKGVPQVRIYLQRLGGIGRSLDPDIWLKQIRPKLLAHIHAGGRAVVTDVRFPNECQFVRSYGVMARTNRDNAEGVPAHVSEDRLPDELINYELDNNLDVPNLTLEIERKIFGKIF
jgi:hypothetical protein